MKHSPGCLCCGDDCTDNCYFPCTGGADNTDCLICGIDIQLPTPDTVDYDDSGLLDEGCGSSAPCWACYEAFDRRFTFFYYFRDPDVSPNPGDTCNDWEFSWFSTFSQYNLFYDDGGGVVKTIYADACWVSNNYNCPYENDLDWRQCPPAGTLLSTSWVNKGNRVGVTLSGNEWDGSCGKLTLTVRYAAVEYSLSAGVIIEGDPMVCQDPKWTEFVHTFELEYCTCAELFGTFTYVSTSTTDSCAGGVDDPCNFSGATIALVKRPEASAFCYVCDCLNCTTNRTDQMSLSISGPVVNGTFILSGFFNSLACQYVAEGPFEGCDDIKNIEVRIYCLACDLFVATISVIHQNNYAAWYGLTEVFGCGDSPTFSQHPLFSGTPPCDIASHTIQLSFVSA